MEQKFYKCAHCGNLLGLIKNANSPLLCCESPMQELIANSVDASTEKHLPSVSVNADTVSVQIGSVMHPMTDEHSIEFIYLQTAQGGQRKALKVGHDPIVNFQLIDDTALVVYAYCNLHGLWKTVL